MKPEFKYKDYLETKDKKILKNMLIVRQPPKEGEYSNEVFSEN
jgi:hypothetical protein